MNFKKHSLLLYVSTSYWILDLKVFSNAIASVENRLNLSETINSMDSYPAKKKHFHLDSPVHENYEKHKTKTKTQFLFILKSCCFFYSIDFVKPLFMESWQKSFEVAKFSIKNALQQRKKPTKSVWKWIVRRRLCIGAFVDVGCGSTTSTLCDANDVS